MPRVFHVTVVSLWWHLQAIECFFRKIATRPVPLWHKQFKQCKDIHHVNLFPFCTGRLPSLKQPKPLPARTLQPRCSGMFFRWAGIQRPNSQKVAIHANRVQELKENNGLIGCLSLRNKYEYVLILHYIARFSRSLYSQQVWHEHGGAIQVRERSSLLQPWGLSWFLLPYRFALDEMPCVELCVGATMKASELTWPSPIFQLTSSTRPQQWQQQEAPASHTRSGKHTNMWFPLLGFTIVMNHRNIRCLQRSLFVTKTGGCTFHKPVGSYSFSNVSICRLNVCRGWDRHLPTRFNKVMNQKLYNIFSASRVHLLSAEARDATGPSLSGGLFSSPRRRVSGLGGPELVTPMLLLQLRPSSSTYSEMMGWFHAALALTY